MINRSLLKGNLAIPLPALKPCPSLITWRRPSCRQLITKSPLESIFSSPRWKLVIEHPSKNLLLSTKHYCSLRDITILLWTRFGVARGGGQHLCSLASEGFLFCYLAPGFLFLFLFLFLFSHFLHPPLSCAVHWDILYSGFFYYCTSPIMMENSSSKIQYFCLQSFLSNTSSCSCWEGRKGKFSPLLKVLTQFPFYVLN